MFLPIIKVCLCLWASMMGIPYLMVPYVQEEYMNYYDDCYTYDYPELILWILCTISISRLAIICKIVLAIAAAVCTLLSKLKTKISEVI
jgi:hypothetical protein